MKRADAAIGQIIDPDELPAGMTIQRIRHEFQEETGKQLRGPLVGYQRFGLSHIHLPPEKQKREQIIIE